MQFRPEGQYPRIVDRDVRTQALIDEIESARQEADAVLPALTPWFGPPSARQRAWMGWPSADTRTQVQKLIEVGREINKIKAERAASRAMTSSVKSAKRASKKPANPRLRLVRDNSRPTSG